MRHISWLGASHLICSHLLNRIFQGLYVPFRERLKYKCTWWPICSLSPAVAERQAFRSEMDGTCSCLWKPDPSCQRSIALRHWKASPDAEVPAPYPRSRRKPCPDPWPAERWQGEVGEQETPSPCPRQFHTRQGTARPRARHYVWSLQGVRGRAWCPLPCFPRLATSSQIPVGGNHGVHGSVPTKRRYQPLVW